MVKIKNNEGGEGWSLLLQGKAIVYLEPRTKVSFGVCLLMKQDFIGHLPTDGIHFIVVKNHCVN